MFSNFGLARIKEFKESFSWRGIPVRRSLLLLFILVVVFGLVAIDFLPDQLQGIQIGKPSPSTVKATRDIEFIDFDKTNALQKEAASRVQNVYTRDWLIESKVIKDIHGFFTSVRQIRANQPMSQQVKLEKMSTVVDASFDQSVVEQVLTIPEAQLNAAEAAVITQIDQFYHDVISKDNIESRKQEFRSAAQSLTQDAIYYAIISEIGTYYLKPNYNLDEKATTRMRNETAASITPVVVSIQKEETVVREGEVVTTAQARVLKELGLMSRGIDISHLGGLALFVLISLAALGLYFFSYQPKIYHSDRLIVVLAVIFIPTLLIAKFVGPFYSYFLIPVATAAMLTALLFNVETAIVSVLTLSIYSGLVADQNYQYTMFALFTGIFAIYAVKNIRHRTDLALAGIRVILATTLLSITVTLLSNAGAVELMKNLGWGLLSGIICAVLTIGTLPFLEQFFGITTDIKLVELSYANQPLMRELMMKAPGTYNHSIMTGNLTESAAEEIGANPLLARVGAYYHDIGKTKRPMFFVENQIGGENPHDHTNPSLSCLIITSHVKEGCDLARKHKLPIELIDIINEHHGTSVVQYFYHKAKESIVKEAVCEEDFRYDGNRPSTKESALVMLADSVEAAARTISKPSPQRIEQLIKRIVQSKLDDGQLSESNLTLKDLEVIIKSFSQVLSSLYHTRIEYPQTEITARSLASHGDPFKQQPEYFS